MHTYSLILLSFVILAGAVERCSKRIARDPPARTKRFLADPLVGASPSVCKAPPFTWCLNDDIAKLCNAQAACKSYKQTVHNQKVNITLLYEAMCGGCSQFITTILYPMWQKDHEHYNIELVPYGNHFGDECQHGWEECVLNRFEACGLNVLRNNFSQAFDFINCMETTIRKLKDPAPETVIQKCFSKLKTPKTIQQSILACNTSALGDQLTTQMKNKTENVWPDQHEWVPWLIINGVSLQSGQNFLDASLDSAIELAYSG